MDNEGKEAASSLANIENEAIRMKMDALEFEIRNLQAQRVAQLAELDGIENMALKKRFKAIINDLLKQEDMKRLEYEVNPDVLNIEKGMVLVYRSLFQLRDEDQLVVLLASLLKGKYYRRAVLELEPTGKLNYGALLIKAVGRIEETRNLIYIAATIDDLEVVTNNKVSSYLPCLYSLIEIL